jgi:hypothetical protein
MARKKVNVVIDACKRRLRDYDRLAGVEEGR